jgi:OmpR-family two-component system manganese-sensing sensor histidine kinase
MQVKVRDTGIGIPEDALPHIFERFYRVDPARSHLEHRNDPSLPFSAHAKPGSGLGLAIAQAIVSNHHGQIRIESTLTQGTTVTVTFPCGKQDLFAGERLNLTSSHS